MKNKNKTEIALDFFLKNILFTLKKPDQISHLLQGVTYSCNSRCQTCSIWRKYQKDPVLKAKELRLDDFQKIASDTAFRLQELNFFGGEPFLRRDLVEITQIFVENQKSLKKIVIPTNGLLTRAIEKYVGQVRKFYQGELAIGISIDGIGKINDQVRGVPGGFKKAESTFKLLKKRKDVSVGVGMTITKENCRQIWEVYKLFGDNFTPVIAHHSQTLDNLDKDFSLGEQELTTIDKQLGKIIKGIEKKRFCWEKFLLRKMTKFYRQPKQIVPCIVPWYHLYIDPYGDVYPCALLSEKLGNARQQSLTKILRSPKRKRIAQQIKQGKCSCWAPCVLYPSTFFHWPTYFWLAKEMPRYYLSKKLANQ